MPNNFLKKLLEQKVSVKRNNRSLINTNVLLLHGLIHLSFRNFETYEKERMDEAMKDIR